MDDSTHKAVKENVNRFEALYKDASERRIRQMKILQKKLYEEKNQRIPKKLKSGTKKKISWDTKWSLMVKRHEEKIKQCEALKNQLERQRNEELSKECTFKPANYTTRFFHKSPEEQNYLLNELKKVTDKQNELREALKEVEENEKAVDIKIQKELENDLLKMTSYEEEDTFIDYYKDKGIENFNKSRIEKFDLLNNLIRLESIFLKILANANLQYLDIQHETEFDTQLVNKLKQEQWYETISANSLKEAGRRRQILSAVANRILNRFPFGAAKSSQAANILKIENKDNDQYHSDCNEFQFNQRKNIGKKNNGKINPNYFPKVKRESFSSNFENKITNNYHENRKLKLNLNLSCTSENNHVDQAIPATFIQKGFYQQRNFKVPEEFATTTNDTTSISKYNKNALLPTRGYNNNNHNIIKRMSSNSNNYIFNYDNNFIPSYVELNKQNYERGTIGGESNFNSAKYFYDCPSYVNNLKSNNNINININKDSNNNIMNMHSNNDNINHAKDMNNNLNEERIKNNDNSMNFKNCRNVQHNNNNSVLFSHNVNDSYEHGNTNLNSNVKKNSRGVKFVLNNTGNIKMDSIYPSASLQSMTRATTTIADRDLSEGHARTAEDINIENRASIVDLRAYSCNTNNDTTKKDIRNISENSCPGFLALGINDKNNVETYCNSKKLVENNSKKINMTPFVFNAYNNNDRLRKLNNAQDNFSKIVSSKNILSSNNANIEYKGKNGALVDLNVCNNIMNRNNLVKTKGERYIDTRRSFIVPGAQMNKNFAMIGTSANNYNGKAPIEPENKIGANKIFGNTRGSFLLTSNGNDSEVKQMHAEAKKDYNFINENATYKKSNFQDEAVENKTKCNDLTRFVEGANENMTNKKKTNISKTEDNHYSLHIPFQQKQPSGVPHNFNSSAPLSLLSNNSIYDYNHYNYYNNYNHNNGTLYINYAQNSDNKNNRHLNNNDLLRNFHAPAAANFFNYSVQREKLSSTHLPSRNMFLGGLLEAEKDATRKLSNLSLSNASFHPLPNGCRWSADPGRNFYKAVPLK